ncbi:hypothetical protein Droror1_Dr00004368 [Drosera rotundifolia]
MIVAVAVPLIVKRLYHPLRKYAGFQKRDIMLCNEHDELWIVACIHRPDNIAAITHLLNIISPTKATPIVAYVLHLMKLVGRFNPVFISHNLQKKKTSQRSYSEDVVWAFDRFSLVNKEAVSVGVFTTISPPKSMHDDICTLALDKLASLIILPFHRKLRIDGSVDSEDQDFRALNRSVFERAPCSVAVLIDRIRMSNFSSSKNLSSVIVNASEICFSVAVSFLGGDDDREALALTQRMSRGRSIKVNVVQLISPDKNAHWMCLMCLHWRKSVCLLPLLGNLVLPRRW